LGQKVLLVITFLRASGPLQVLDEANKVVEKEDAGVSRTHAARPDTASQSQKRERVLY
jgi:hypothetical protein